MEHLDNHLSDEEYDSTDTQSYLKKLDSDDQDLSKYKWSLVFPPVLSSRMTLVEFIDIVRNYYNFPLKKILRLKVSDCQGITDNHLKYALHHLPSLTTLELKVMNETKDNYNHRINTYL